ncbi:MAG: SDR family oxidoreductase [Balneolaceae bacterium]
MIYSNFAKKIGAYSAYAIGGYLVGKMIMRARRTFTLNNKVVLITGGTRGLGLVLARRIAQEGGKVVVCGRSNESLEEASRDLEKITSKHYAMPCDITDKQQVKQLIQRINVEVGTVDVLINNAGIIQVGPMELMNDEDYQSAMDVHTWGALNLINEVLPGMKRKKVGRIINIISIGGMISYPHLLPYNVSKHALSGLSKGVAAEINERNIRVTSVYPGLMRTGSPRNVDVKGQHKKEYAWFKILDSLPGISMNVDKAASRIVEALKRGDQTLILSFPAKIAAFLQVLAPDFTISMFKLDNYFLPSEPRVADGSQIRKGYESESELSRSILTEKTDEAAVENLER